MQKGREALLSLLLLVLPFIPIRILHLRQLQLPSHTGTRTTTNTKTNTNYSKSYYSCITIADYLTHPCKRNCLALGHERMRCEYNFTLETYQTLSRACYDCPNNAADCARPHCIPGDGFVRAVKVVNRMLPGPAIHVSYTLPLVYESCS